MSVLRGGFMISVYNGYFFLSFFSLFCRATRLSLRPFKMAVLDSRTCFVFHALGLKALHDDTRKPFGPLCCCFPFSRQKMISFDVHTPRKSSFYLPLMQLTLTRQLEDTLFILHVRFWYVWLSYP